MSDNTVMYVVVIVSLIGTLKSEQWSCGFDENNCVFVGDVVSGWKVASATTNAPFTDAKGSSSGRFLTGSVKGESWVKTPLIYLSSPRELCLEFSYNVHYSTSFQELKVGFLSDDDNQPSFPVHIVSVELDSNSAYKWTKVKAKFTPALNNHYIEIIFVSINNKEQFQLNLDEIKLSDSCDGASVFSSPIIYIVVITAFIIILTLSIAFVKRNRMRRRLRQQQDEEIDRNISMRCNSIQVEEGNINPSFIGSLNNISVDSIDGAPPSYDNLPPPVYSQRPPRNSELILSTTPPPSYEDCMMVAEQSASDDTSIPVAQNAQNAIK